MLFLLPSVLVLLPRLLRVHPTLLLFLRYYLQRVPFACAASFPFCFCAAAAVSVSFFLGTAFKFIISLVDQISFLMLFFSIVLDHAALTPFLSSYLQSDSSSALITNVAITRPAASCHLSGNVRCLFLGRFAVHCVDCTKLL